MGCCCSAGPALVIPPKLTIEAAPADPSTQSGPTYRNAKYPELRDYAFEDVRTLYDAFQRGLKVSAKRPCMGYRPIESVSADGKDVKVGPFVWKTYEECAELRDHIGSAIAFENLAPPNPTDASRLIGIFSKNRYEWVVAEQAANAFGVATVALYDTLGADAVSFILRQAEIVTVFVEKSEIKTLFAAKRLQGEEGRLSHIVSFEDVTEAEVTSALAEGITLRSFSALLAIGKANPMPHTPPFPEQLATICYTSGTTGDPKGVMLSNRNITADVAGAILGGITLSNEDVHLSYLPLAHMFERLVETALWSAGARVGFYQGSPSKLLDDLAALKPTLFPSVPRLFNRICDKVMGTIESTPGIKGKMLRKAYEVKKANLRKNILTHPFWDAKVFSKILARLGLERVRILLTGSAPIAPHVMDFFRILFSCDFYEGYGQTECSGAATLSISEDVMNIGHVGVPFACNEIKLVSVEEMGYRVDDTVHGVQLSPEGAVLVTGEPCLGRGEICYRGANVFLGYYKAPEKTAEVVDADGWLHSGDIGLWTPLGYLRVIDRKKNIFKLSQGEYVAAEKIENVYTSSPLIAQVFVYGDSLQSSLVAIVVPDEAAVKAWAAANNIPGSTVHDWVKNPALKDYIKKDMDKTAKEGKLKGFEMVRDFRLEASPFSVENDLFTPTFKLKRNVAKQRYQAQIDEMYGGALGVVAGMVGLKQGAQAAGVAVERGAEETK